MAGAVASQTGDLPADVRRVLDDFVAAAQSAFAGDLISVVLYGSAAEGALRETSDVNVLLVLTAFDPARAGRLRDTLRTAQAAIRLSAMFVLRDEVEAATTAFAQKFADIARRHRVLAGEDPFGQGPSRAALVTRLDQVLLNLILRMRALYVQRGGHEEQLAGVVAEMASPLRTSAASLAALEGRAVRSPKTALAEFAQSLGDPAWSPILSRLSTARETRALPPGVAGETVMRLIELAQQLRARVVALR